MNGVSLWESHLLERVITAKDVSTWFVESDDENTYLYANFLGKDPNREERLALEALNAPVRGGA